MVEILEKLRATCKERNIPIISLATESFLWKLLRKYKPKICLEIWGAVWYSSIYMSRIINTWGGKITSFEIWYPSYQEGLRNIKEAHCYNIIWYPYDVRYAPIKKLVQAWPSDRQSPVDFIFIDGQKSQYGDYMEIIEKISSPHTVIVIDDVIKYHNKLSSLYGYIEKKQIKCIQSPKTQMKSSVLGWENDTGDFWHRKHKPACGKQVNEVLSDFKNSRVYEIMQLEPDDGVMIIKTNT